MKYRLYKPEKAHDNYGKLCGIKSNGSNFYQDVLKIEIVDDKNNKTTIGKKLEELEDLVVAQNETINELKQSFEILKNETDKKLLTYKTKINDVIKNINDHSIL